LEVDYVSLFKKKNSPSIKEEEKVLVENEKDKTKNYFDFYNSCFDTPQQSNPQKDLFDYTNYVDTENKFKTQYYSNQLYDYENKMSNYHTESQNQLVSSSENEIIYNTGFNEIKIISMDLDCQPYMSNNSKGNNNNENNNGEEIDMFELFGSTKKEEKSEFCFSNTTNNVNFNQKSAKDEKTTNLIENLNSLNLKKKEEELENKNSNSNSIEDFFDFFSDVNKKNEEDKIKEEREENKIIQVKVENDIKEEKRIEEEQEEYEKLSLVEKQKRDFENILKIPKKTSENSSRSRSNSEKELEKENTKIEKKLKKEFQPTMERIPEEKEVDDLKKEEEVSAEHSSLLWTSYEEKEDEQDEDKVLKKLKKMKLKRCMIKI